MQVQLNEHNKSEYPPMHTAEHIINRTMVNMFGCKRSNNAHIERKKSKISFELPECPAQEQTEEIIQCVNAVIEADMPVTYDYEQIDHVEAGIALDKLPDDVSRTIRIVRVGDYDKCACIGNHVEHTAQIGKVVLLGTNWDDERKSFRIRFKLENTQWKET